MSAVHRQGKREQYKTQKADRTAPPIHITPGVYRLCLSVERETEREMITNTSLQSLSESEQERKTGSRRCQSARCGTCKRSMKTYVFINAAGHTVED